MGKPIPLEIDYHFEGDISGTLRLRVTGSHLEPTHAVTESTPLPAQRQGSADVSFAPNAYGLATLFVFLDDQPLHISMFRLVESQDGSGIQVISGPAKPIQFEELPLPEDVEIS
jgi:hypothetical protein